jgi:hypothetical protein
VFFVVLTPEILPVILMPRERLWAESAACCLNNTDTMITHDNTNQDANGKFKNENKHTVPIGLIFALIVVYFLIKG